MPPGNQIDRALPQPRSLLWEEEQQGLSFADISDVSEDSDAPVLGWKDPRKLSPASRARQEAEMAADTARQEIVERARFKRDLELYGEKCLYNGGVQKPYRNVPVEPEDGLLTPTGSPSRRPINAAEFWDWGNNDPVPEEYRWPPPRRERQTSEEIEKEAQHERDWKAWLDRCIEKDVRRKRRLQLYTNRLNEWYAKKAADAAKRDKELGVVRPNKTNKGLKKLTPTMMWRRRGILVQSDLTDHTGQFTESFLKDVSTKAFHEIYHGLCRAAQKLIQEWPDRVRECFRDDKKRSRDENDVDPRAAKRLMRDDRDRGRKPAVSKIETSTGHGPPVTDKDEIVANAGHKEAVTMPSTSPQRMQNKTFTKFTTTHVQGQRCVRCQRADKLDTGRMTRSKSEPLYEVRREDA